MLIKPTNGVLLGTGKLDKEAMSIIEDDTAMRRHVMRNMPADVSSEEVLCPNGKTVVHEYIVQYRSNDDGKVYKTTLGGVSDSHAWEEASYADMWPDELLEANAIDVEILSVTKMLPSGQVI